MRVPIFTIFFFFVSCTASENNKEVLVKQTTIKNKQAAPNLVVTEDSLLITDVSIGKLKIGDSFADVEKFYSRVKTVEMESEGTPWPAKRVDLGNGEWILVESTAGMGTIDRMSTNSKKFRTKRGYHIGQRLVDVLTSSGNAGVDIDEGFMSVRLYDDNISLQVDKASEELFYKKDSMKLSDIRSEARIALISIF